MQGEHKNNVLLTELIMAVLFFSLIAVTVVQTFVAAHQKSRRNAHAQEAMVLAQDWAERLAGREEPAKLLLDEGFAGSGDRFIWVAEGGHFQVEVALRPEEASEAGRLIRADVSVVDRAVLVAAVDSGDDPPAPLATLPVASYVPAEEVPR